MKKVFLSILLTLSSLCAWSQVITQQMGWLESAYVKWTPVAGASSYNVYYTGGGLTNVKIDNSLIRSYNTYFRADILGLAAGAYTITVKPVIGGVEGAGTTSSSVTVLAQDRSGFAFKNGRIPGAYNTNGTLKTNAVVLYVTQNTKNTVSLTVTTSSKAATTVCTGLQSILDGYKKGFDNRPLDIRLVGNITEFTTMSNGDIVIENNNNVTGSITIEGVGNDAVANGWGIRVKTASNIEIRNLGFMLTRSTELDDVGLQQDNEYVWVHNCDLFYGTAGSDADQIKGDGAMDCKLSTYVTFSYNHFWDAGKSHLLGLSENTTTGLYITYHHNWYDHSDSRHPRVRFYSAHVYNNYYDGNSKYGAGSTMGSSVFMEANLFRNCKYPMLTSLQGTDIFTDATGGFSGEAGGTIKAFNNSMTGQTRYVPYNASTNPIQFDAVEVANRNDQISNTIKSKAGANTYNNFDTDAAVMYAYTPDAPAVAQTNVMKYSGRMEGGDITFTFNNSVDDASSSINTALKNLLTSYNTSMVFVQGETPVVVNTQTLTATTNNTQTVSSGSPIAAIVYTWGGDATDATVTGLPAAGLSFVKDATAKTITVTGKPTADVSFSVVSSGKAGSPVTQTGSITVLPPGTAAGNLIHNFTKSGKVSTFYTITGNMNSTPGAVTYDGQTLTERLKMESTTTITYTTADVSRLTLVFDADFVGTVKVATVSSPTEVSYTAVNGIVSIPAIPVGAVTISKGSTTNLFYIKTEYPLPIVTSSTAEVAPSSIRVFPNPVNDMLHFQSTEKIKSVAIYTSVGVLLQTIIPEGDAINLSSLNEGIYLIKITTKEGSFTEKIIKK